ncbi:MAG: AAA family ATPase [Oscillospiraceae bacterium]
MGIYFNPTNDLFADTALHSKIYVDKTLLIDFTNSCLFGENKEIFVSRPRRFGKSIAENMLVAYYSKGCQSKELFAKFKIAQTPAFEKHLNQHNVIHVDMQKFVSRTNGIDEMLNFLQKRVLKEMKRAFSCIDKDEESLITALEERRAFRTEYV